MDYLYQELYLEVNLLLNEYSTIAFSYYMDRNFFCDGKGEKSEFNLVIFVLVAPKHAASNIILAISVLFLFFIYCQLIVYLYYFIT